MIAAVARGVSVTRTSWLGRGRTSAGSVRILQVLFLIVGLIAIQGAFGAARADQLSDVLREIERCAVIESTISRGECYDSLANRLELAPRVEQRRSAGRWQLGLDQSEFDDTKSVYLSLDADEKVKVSRYDVVRPKLWLRCMENTTALFVDYKHFLGSDRIDVEYRIDRAAAQRGRWSISTDHHAAGLWRGAGAIPFIRRLLGKDRLLIRLTPYGENTSTVSFTVTGLETAVGELAAACNWKP